jgi:nucleoside phosphorylase
MPMELAPLRRRMEDAQPFPALGGRAVSGRLAGLDVVATAVGVGTRRATETTERVLQTVSVPLVIVVGIAGASAPHLKIADVVVPESVIHGPAGTTHTSTASIARLDRKGTIRTHDELLVDAEGVAALHRQGISAMDMETGAIAAVCEREGVEWTAFRAISDNVERPVDPASMTMLNPDGTPNVGASIRFMLRRPHRIPILIRSGRDTMKACNAAAEAAIRALEGVAKQRPDS